ncbi:hypothetical protein EV586_1027 [Tumebacillus sp. BK434]|uniref:hypothetical protein n=1 Tax=Tumebacillus sp. BK434 TaxID=2512169 RepID=UPI001042DB16|nr:hypothetical protein [Tumebacillus sp. BK434]TCP57566.1 hypothetical protein EV586_1027 [Tumebacillus sp. BK434]
MFHSQVTGSVAALGPAEPFYEMAMVCRAMENTTYFASINHALGHQEWRTTLVAPDGNLVASVPLGEEKLLVSDLNLEQATWFLAKRYNPDLYQGEGDV